MLLVVHIWPWYSHVWCYLLTTDTTEICSDFQSLLSLWFSLYMFWLLSNNYIRWDRSGFSQVYCIISCIFQISVVWSVNVFLCPLISPTDCLELPGSHSVARRPDTDDHPSRLSDLLFSLYKLPKEDSLVYINSVYIAQPDNLQGATKLCGTNCWISH